MNSIRGRVQRTFLEKGKKYLFASWEWILGQLYLQIAAKTSSVSLSVSENHLKKAIEVAEEIGAKTVLGPAYLDLGLLRKTEGRVEEARKCILDAIRISEECDATGVLKQAKQALQDLG